MSTYRFRYAGGTLGLRYRAVAAAEYLGATVKTAFQLAAAPADDPVKSLYAVFHDLRKVSEDLHAKYRGQFPDWQHEGKDENGDTGLWRARVDCQDIILDKLKQTLVRAKGESSNILHFRILSAMFQFNDAATSEFRFRHTLNYYSSGRDNNLMSTLEKMAPLIREALPGLEKIDVETLRASKENHAAARSAHKQKYDPPGPSIE